MYKSKIKELESAKNKIVNGIKTKQNVVQFYENMLEENDESWKNAKLEATTKLNSLKKKRLCGKIFIAGALIGAILMFTPFVSINALILPEIILTSGTILLNAKAKEDKMCVKQIKQTLNDAKEQEEELRELLQIAKQKIECSQKILQNVESKIQELTNAQETYDRIANKYSIKINFGCLNKENAAEK